VILLSAGQEWLVITFILAPSQPGNHLNFISSPPSHHSKLKILVFWQNLGLGFCYRDTKLLSEVENQTFYRLFISSYSTEKYLYFHSPSISLMIITIISRFNKNVVLEDIKETKTHPYISKCMRFVFDCLSDIFNKYDIATIHHQYPIAILKNKFIFDFFYHSLKGRPFSYFLLYLLDLHGVSISFLKCWKYLSQYPFDQSSPNFWISLNI